MFSYNAQEPVPTRVVVNEETAAPGEEAAQTIAVYALSSLVGAVVSQTVSLELGEL